MINTPADLQTLLRTADGCGDCLDAFTAALSTTIGMVARDTLIERAFDLGGLTAGLAVSVPARGPGSGRHSSSTTGPTLTCCAMLVSARKRVGYRDSPSTTVRGPSSAVGGSK